MEAYADENGTNSLKVQFFLRHQTRKTTVRT